MIVLMLAAGAWPQTSKPSFARDWWLKSDAEERSGLLNGVADCLTWTAHKKGFSATPEQIMDRIDRFYKSHPGSVSLNVIDVWQKVRDEPESSRGSKGQEEIWKNAHWYLNGEWWSQVSEAQQLGFLEGYLWCVRAQVPTTTEVYSGSASSYRRKVDAFVKENPKQGKESVAITLRRYKDKTE